MSVESEYMIFAAKPSRTGKTRIVSVCSKRTGILLGEIRWFGRWRQYCFYPEGGTIFNRSCMRDILAYIEELKP